MKTQTRSEPACSSVPFERHVGQQRLFDDDDSGVELHLQSILSSRRRANASGQAAEDAGNIRAALRLVPPNVELTGRARAGNYEVNRHFARSG